MERENCLMKDKEGDSLITVVIPHFKTDMRQTSECIEALFNQDFSGWEGIIIDDGNSGDIAKELDLVAARDPRLRIIHTTNNGVSGARNIGIESSRSKYIYFCDPDDLMLPNELSQLLTYAEKYDSDIVFCEYKPFRKMSENIISTESDEIVDLFKNNENDILIRYLISSGRSPKGYKLDKTCIAFVWGHLYRAELIRDIKFVTVIRAEDVLFNLHCLKRAKMTVVLHETLHLYRISNGVSGRYDNRVYASKIVFVNEVIKFVTENPDIGVEDSELSSFELAAVSEIKRNVYKNLSSLSYRERRKEIQEFSDVYFVKITDRRNRKNFNLTDLANYYIIRYKLYFIYNAYYILKNLKTSLKKTL